MSEAALRDFAPPVVERAAPAPAWMTRAPSAVRSVSFSALGSAAPAPKAPPIDPTAAAPRQDAQEPSMEQRVETALATERAELAAAREALEAEREALRAEREGLRACMASAEQARARLLEESEAAMLDVAAGIAEALVGAAFEADPDLLARMAQSAIELLGGRLESGTAGIELRLGAFAHEAIAASVSGGALHGTSTQGVALPPVGVSLDATLGPYDCVAVAGHARVDASLAERLGAVRVALAHERRRAPEGA